MESFKRDIGKGFVIFQISLMFVHQLQAQNLSNDKIENKLYEISEIIQRYQLGNVDSMTFYCELYSKSFKESISKNPNTMSYTFSSLVKYHFCDITNSSDGLLRIYSWDDQMGGTMRSFDNIFQYKVKGQVYTKILDENESNKTGLYSNIYTLKVNNSVYYLAINNNTYSSKDCGQSINVFSIENGRWNDSVKIIKTSSGFTNKINVNYDFMSVADRQERPARLIKYDEEQKTIYIPIVLEDRRVSKRFIIYQFNGQYFERVKK